MTLNTRKPNPHHRSSAKNISSIHSTTPVENLLSRLDGVKQTAPGKWQSRCPAHDDRSPSLGIREADDGTVLVHCWAGCGADAVVRAVGLDLRDLFPTRFDVDGKPAKAPRFNAADVVRTVLTESTILMLGYRTIQRGERLDADDRERVELAITTLMNCKKEALCR